MIIYKYGKIMHVNTNYLILDHNGEGELIYVPKIDRFKREESRKIFISNIDNEYSKVTYGFENFKELVVFEDLISLQGVGPKTAISILNEGWEYIISLIANGDFESLGKIPYVSSRVANAIVFAYKDKYAKFLAKLNDEDALKIKASSKVNEAINKFEETMKMLGFKHKQIKYAMDHIVINDNVEKCVEDAINLISQHQNEIRV
ncbi:Holliday junction DNA helicase subunit RuvA [Metamycoplasma subdolum]|uniref:Holliday junction branch migration complex subunit RuvA n=1 Tax=Metamycoplasma subdolum TaxID=92407 RepID=A0A3M0A1Z2_9BACT|nr:Holliday junction branch migration protein RuvA [Metamycoplasma subdolum]RMA78646.1 Holliday junction DNA helicase subunit RuvA [Metamycoplasma subdolum]WPB50752.1 Holliday junction branch migration protein RuvA [Metamycoplasma subdolum]